MTEAMPSTTASAVREPLCLVVLLLAIGATNGGGWDRAADHAGDGDQREDVRESLEQRGDRRRVLLHRTGERAREPEQETRSGSADGSPVSEDQGSERDEAAACGEVRGEAQDREREVRSAGGG